MLSLFFGIAAALAWGVHDVCVRFVTDRAGVVPALLAVFATGLVLVAAAAFGMGGLGQIGGLAALAAAASGLAYAGGCYGLYRAFAIGPVRLVAPVLGAYPVLSLLWAAALGQPPSLGQAMAVLAVIVGVAVTAVTAHAGHDGATGSARAAIGWSAIGAFGFALTFALGQLASRTGGELSSVLIARAAAFGAILLVTVCLGLRPRLGGMPWGLLILMGCCDAAALGLVISAGGLPHPEFAAVAASTFGMVTVLLAWAFLGERLNARQWGAVGLVFAGIGYLAL